MSAKEPITDENPVYVELNYTGEELPPEEMDEINSFMATITATMNKELHQTIQVHLKAFDLYIQDVINKRNVVNGTYFQGKKNVGVESQKESGSQTQAGGA